MRMSKEIFKEYLKFRNMRRMTRTRYAKLNKIVIEHLGEVFQIEKVNWKRKTVEVDNGDEFRFDDITFLKPIPMKKVKEELVVEAI